MKVLRGMTRVEAYMTQNTAADPACRSIVESGLFGWLAAARFCLRSPFLVLTIGLLRIGAHGDCYSFGGYQFVGKARQHAPLDVVTTNSTAIVADPFAEMAKTAVAIIDDAILAAATSAGEQARQKESRAARAVQPFRASGADAVGRSLELPCKLGLAQLHTVPQLVIDNPQLRHLGPDPLGLRVRA
jgi:hypothetical protein